jgi:hypothetical protein
MSNAKTELVIHADKNERRKLLPGGYVFVEASDGRWELIELDDAPALKELVRTMLGCEAEA